MTNGEKEIAQQTLNTINDTILEMKKEIQKAELLVDRINKAIAKIKPTEKRNKRRK